MKPSFGSNPDAFVTPKEKRLCPHFTAFSYCSLTALFYWTFMSLSYGFSLSNVVL
ncbi:hypothetical protein T11_1437 [Trichinella zimbabwensis]|uniref:Uncharacterized protein n=1 Tax=Trichinella zimbabwensis TaxID=268475 RepID=A0A0V1GLC6_9BILA|nr:hypothetical protein T11_1437 [Trichinella zimbabwensis]